MADERLRKRLERERLEESLLFYHTADDVQTVAASSTVNAPDDANLQRQMDELGLAEGAVRNITQGLAYAIGMNRQRGRTLNLTEKTDPADAANLDYFQVDMTKETVAGMIGTDYDPNQNAANQRRFYSFKFRSDAAKQQTLRDLVQFVYLKTLAPFTNAEAAAAFPEGANVEAQQELYRNRRGRQRTACLEFLGRCNTLKAMNEYSEDISSHVQNKIVRTTTLTGNTRDFVPAPVLGKMSNAEPDVLRNINSVIANTPFGSPQNLRPLSFFLETISGTINGQYNEKGAYQILCNVLSNTPLQTATGNKEDGIDFASTWIDLQVTYSNYGNSSEDIANRIRETIRTRPRDPTTTIGQLRELIRKKNRDKDIGERQLITNVESRDCIFAFLQTWWPTYYPTVKQRFEEINFAAKSQNIEPKPAPILLTFLVREYIKNAPPLSQKSAEAHALSVDVSVSEMSEQSLVNETNRFLASQNPQVAAFQQQNFNHQNTGAKPRTNNRSFQVPPNLQGKCWKCASADGHMARECPHYPNERLGSTACLYCGGLHISECINLKRQQQPKMAAIGVQSLPALPAPAQSMAQNVPQIAAASATLTEIPNNQQVSMQQAFQGQNSSQ